MGNGECEGGLHESYRRVCRHLPLPEDRQGLHSTNRLLRLAVRHRLEVNSRRSRQGASKHP